METMEISSINTNTLNTNPISIGGSLQPEYEQFLGLEKSAAEQLQSAKPGSFEFKELTKLLEFAEKGAKILHHAIEKHGGQLSPHERKDLEDLLNRVNNQCSEIRSHSTSGQDNPLYLSMLSCYQTCDKALNN